MLSECLLVETFDSWQTKLQQTEKKKSSYLFERTSTEKTGHTEFLRQGQSNIHPDGISTFVGYLVQIHPCRRTVVVLFKLKLLVGQQGSYISQWYLIRK